VTIGESVQAQTTAIIFDDA